VLVLALLCASLATAADPPRFGWSQTLWEAQGPASPAGDCAVRALLVDNRDAVIVAGFTSRSVGYGVRAMPLIVKYSAEGRRLWSRSALGRRQSVWGEIRLAAVHESREITAWGVVGESADDPLRVPVFARFGPKGELRWTRTLTVPGFREFRPIALAAVPGGDLVVTGEVPRLDPAEGSDWGVIRLDARLGVRWVRIHDREATGEAAAGDVVVDAAGTAFVIGRGRIGLGPERWLVEGYGPAAERRLYAWMDGDPACVTQTGRRLAVCGRGLLVTGDQVCNERGSTVFVRRLDREGRTLWNAAARTTGRAAAVVALPSGGAVIVGEERAVEETGGLAWPLAMRWNAQGDLMMACRGLRKDEAGARYAAAAVDSDGNLVVAGEKSLVKDASPRIFVRKLRF
jgi:hypothetical protein